MKPVCTKIRPGYSFCDFNRQCASNTCVYALAQNVYCGDVKGGCVCMPDAYGKSKDYYKDGLQDGFPIYSGSSYCQYRRRGWNTYSLQNTKAFWHTVTKKKASGNKITTYKKREKLPNFNNWVKPKNLKSMYRCGNKHGGWRL